MNILVTGGSGFLGSHITDALINRGHKTSVLDRQKSEFVNGAATFIQGDVTDSAQIATILKGYDAVYHCAGIAGIDDCKQSPQNTIKVNVQGTLNVLEACVSNNVNRFIFASSAYVFSKYGYFYRTSKLACENLISDFNALYGLNYTNLRFGSLYGRRADDRNSVYRLLKTALKDGKIVYKGTGTELREFIHVQDAAEIAVDILADEYINKSIIITGTEKYRYIDVLNMIREIIDKDVKLELQEREDNCHYSLTPYSFNPDLGHKVVRTNFIDFGQGLLDILHDIIQRQIHEEQ